LAKECYTTKMELLTNITVVDDAIRFVSEKSKNKEEQVKNSSSSSSSDRYDDENSDKLAKNN
jgi:hypothetical protein